MAATNSGFVNINSDLGESFGPWVMGTDTALPRRSGPRPTRRPRPEHAELVPSCG